MRHHLEPILTLPVAARRSRPRRRRAGPSPRDPSHGRRLDSARSPLSPRPNPARRAARQASGLRTSRDVPLTMICIHQLRKTFAPERHAHRQRGKRRCKQKPMAVKAVGHRCAGPSTRRRGRLSGKDGRRSQPISTTPLGLAEGGVDRVGGADEVEQRARSHAAALFALQHRGADHEAPVAARHDVDGWCAGAAAGSDARRRCRALPAPASPP